MILLNFKKWLCSEVSDITGIPPILQNPEALTLARGGALPTYEVETEKYMKKQSKNKKKKTKI